MTMGSSEQNRTRRRANYLEGRHKIYGGLNDKQLTTLIMVWSIKYCQIVVLG
jgi:hypothetical protein